MEIDKLTHRVIGCCMEIHNTLGNGFQEVIYQRALVYEFHQANINFARELEMDIHYKDQILGTRRVDFFVHNCLMVELKAVERLTGSHKAQAINYCEAYGVADGLLINFGGTSLEFNRVYNNKLVSGF